MTDVSFDRLRDVVLREAWPHEANHFTPWLAQNIDHIAEAVGMPLELTDTEVSVGTYYADILARNLQDNSVVLIENQLEATDHTHLGQIMTYLAGLEAKTVVWIAPAFREPHRSAIRWLNQNTADGFAFFALRLRVVRIGDSPYAPMFEVVEKPNDWERVLHAKVEAVESDVGRMRQAFWTTYLERHPDAAVRGLTKCRLSNVWLPALPNSAILGLYVASRTCGVYLRGPSRSSFEEVLSRFLPHRGELEGRLGVPLTSEAEPNWLLVSRIPYPVSDKAHWPEIIDFMEERAKLYLTTLTEIFGEPGA